MLADNFNTCYPPDAPTYEIPPPDQWKTLGPAKGSCAIICLPAPHSSISELYGTSQGSGVLWSEPGLWPVSELLSYLRLGARGRILVAVELGGDH